MKNKVLKSIIAFGALAVMTLTFTVNTNESNQIDSTLDNILVLNQASAEKTNHCFSCDDMYPDEVCYYWNDSPRYGRYSNESYN